MQRRSMLSGVVASVVAAAAGLHPTHAQGKEIVVFAAASLKNALDNIDEAWRHGTGKGVTVSYGASSTLAKQIENGAPADLFISADLDWMDYLEQRKLIAPASRVNLLGNVLVLVAPADSAAQVTVAAGFPLAALLGDGRLAMADPAAVPAGRYGKAALTKLGVWDAVAGRVAAAETVRAALLLVARGEAPLGIVYQTDAAVEPGVRIIGTFPPDSHPPIIYPMALTASSTNPAAPPFAAHLRGPAARSAFQSQGFTVLDEAR